MKKIIILLFFILLAYAAGENSSFEKPKIIESGAIAIILSALVLALLYMIGYGFGIQSLTITTKDEMYHLLISIVLLASFTAITISLDEIFGGEKGLWVKSNTTITQDIENFTAVLNSIDTYGRVAIEGSKMDTCQLFTASITSTTCGGYSALTTPVNLAHSIVTMVLMSYSSLQVLLELAISAGMKILFPLGIFFYSFKFTRPLGATLVATAFALYVLLPFMIVEINDVYEKYLINSGSQTKDFKYICKNVPETIGEFEQLTQEALDTIYLGDLVSTPSCLCDPKDGIGTNEKKVLNIYKNMQDFLDYAGEFILIKGLLFPIVYVLSLGAGIRGIAAVAGVEVDVSALMRLM